MKCPSCGVETSGNFCFACGASLKSETCPSCGAAVAPGSKFCTSCGSPLTGRGAASAGPGKPHRGGARAGGVPRPGGGAEKPGPEPAGSRAAGPGPVASGPGNLAWWVAGGLMAVLIVVLGYPILSRGSGAGVPGAGGAPAGMGDAPAGSGLVDLSTMTLEEQGTSLFNRVMRSSSAGDTADVAFFLPKALVVYGELNPTDPDGLYHYALLYLEGGNYEEALAKAREGLGEVPDYLLLLAVGAKASIGLGDTTTAREYYGHLVEVYDTEMTLLRPGYDHHQQILPVYREEARAFLGGR